MVQWVQTLSIFLVNCRFVCNILFDQQQSQIWWELGFGRGMPKFGIVETQLYLSCLYTKVRQYSVHTVSLMDICV